MIDKQQVAPQETEKAEQPPAYGSLEETIQDLIIGNDGVKPKPELDDTGRITALHYRIKGRRNL